MQSENLIKAAENLTGMFITSSAIDETKCNICQRATSKRVMSRVPSQRPEEVYTEVNTDVITNSHPGYQKEKYLTLYTDSTSLYIHESMTSTKDGIKHEFKKHQMYISTQTGITIKWYRLDGGCEYGGLTDFIEEQGIRLHITSPYNSEQNGRAEVSNHIICTIACKLMLQAQLPPKFWPLAIKTAVLLHNLTPSDTLNGKSPYQVLAEQLNWPVKLPYLGHLCAYGCWTTVKDHSIAQGGKFAACGLTGQLVSYEGSNIYLVYLRNGQKVIRSTNIQFDKSKIGPVTGVASMTEEEETGTLGELFDDYFINAFEHATSDHASPGGEGVSEELESEEPVVGGVYNGAVEASKLADEELDTGIPQLGGTTGPAALPPALAQQQSVSTLEPCCSSCVTKPQGLLVIQQHHTILIQPLQ